MSDFSEQLAREIAEYLANLGEAQQQLAAHVEQRHVCLAVPEPAKLIELAKKDLHLATRLNQLIERRNVLLAKGAELGLVATSLSQLVAKLETPQQQTLVNQVRQLSRRADTLRRNSWVQWVVCQRSLIHYHDLVQLIANGGKKVPSYGNREQPFSGGAILDASI